jgi:diguanylate cyclase (GGDEF)-like protein
MKEQALQILAEARKRLDTAQVSLAERETLMKLIEVLATAVEQFSQDPKELTSLAQAVVDHHALLTMLKQQAEELSALKKLSITLTSSLDLSDVLDTLVSEALQLIPDTQDVHIFLYNDGKLSFGAALDASGNKSTPWSKPRENGLTYTVARSGEMIIVDDIQNHPLYANAPSSWHGSIIGIPLKTDDTVVGVMNLARSNVGGFTASELRLISLLADQAAVAISNARLHQMVSRQAYTDILTGLPNRRALDERLEEEIIAARRGNYSFAVVMMDLDGFKNINDTYGHPVGDEVLKIVFKQMARRIRTTDFLARYGGDELTLILTQSDIASAKIVTSKVSDELKRIKYTLPDKKRLRLSVSGGIAIYPVHARTATDLLRAADAALYQAKKYNRGTFQIARGVTGPLAPQNIIAE